MDSSNSSCCNYNPISFITTENDIHDSSSFINFPNSPQSTNHYDEAVYLYEQLCFSPYHQQPITITPENNHTHDIITATTTTTTTTTNTNIPTLIIPDSKPMKIQKSSKKDRHSKINTKNGPRDRRMRLALDVARKFFDLQDMLGFDKASRTVDWLLKNSWNAIKGLSGMKTNTTCAGSSISEEYNHCIEQQEVLSSSSKKKIVNNNKINNKRKEITTTRVIVGKEARKKARERARNRTSQKRRLIITAQNPISCEGRRGNIIGMDRDEIVVENNNNNSIFYDSTAPWNGSNVTQENAALFHSHHLAELQFCGKQWEAYEAYNGSNFSG